MRFSSKLILSCALEFSWSRCGDFSKRIQDKWSVLLLLFLKNNLFNKLEKEEEIDVSKPYLPVGLSYYVTIEVCFQCGFVVSSLLCGQNFEFGIEIGFQCGLFS